MAGHPEGYTIVYLDGPNHGMIATGEDAVATLLILGYLPGERADIATGKRVRSAMPLAVKYAVSQGVGVVEAIDVLRSAGVDVDGAAEAIYQLESVGDPCILRYAGKFSEMID